MTTLIIHPKDRSTTFLNSIYANIEDKTVVQEGATKNDIKALIQQHDRVIMLGHGGPHGLFSLGLFPDCRGGVIDASCVPFLEKKDNSIFIWCNADRFVVRHNLKGFYSGMFISEVREAKYCRVKADQEMVDESNNQFCHILSGAINQDDMYEDVLLKYGQIASNNAVAQYNHDRLFLSDGEVDLEREAQEQGMEAWELAEARADDMTSIFDIIGNNDLT